MGVGDFYGGRWDEALAFYERGQQVSAKCGDLVGVMLLKDNVAEILCERGQLEEAETILRGSLRFWKASRHRFFLGQCQRYLGRVLARTGRFEEALSAFQEARAEFVHMGALEEVLSTDVRTAECRVMMGEGQEALTVITEALQRGDIEEDVSLSTPLLERVRGFALAQSGDLGAARAAFDASLHAGRARRDDYEVGLTLHALVWLGRIDGQAAPGGVEDEASSILRRLGVDKVPGIPLPGPNREDATSGPVGGRSSTPVL
jgi:tetratricopeptide (TPR) repeat protein